MADSRLCRITQERERTLLLSFRFSEKVWQCVQDHMGSTRRALREMKLQPEHAPYAHLLEGAPRPLEDSVKMTPLSVARTWLRKHTFTQEHMHPALRRPEAQRDAPCYFVVGDAYQTADYFTGWGASAAIIQAFSLAQCLASNLAPVHLQRYREVVYQLHGQIARGYMAPETPEEKKKRVRRYKMNIPRARPKPQLPSGPTDMQDIQDAKRKPIKEKKSGKKSNTKTIQPTMDTRSSSEEEILSDDSEPETVQRMTLRSENNVGLHIT